MNDVSIESVVPMRISEKNVIARHLSVIVAQLKSISEQVEQDVENEEDEKVLHIKQMYAVK